MITYWHNPRCSKSRAGLTFFDERGVALTVRKYLEDSPGIEELKAVQSALGVAPLEMMRRKDQIFKDLGLGPNSDPEALFQAMVDHPILIERPIAIHGDKAVIGRPTEAFETLLDC
ncbi:MAG: arsenate reductase (glutaredoxin) [Rhodobacteraceae bacterium]|nr:arsenate reductase (glutaredoxin) [Paracoccaceae bacterium]